MENYGFIYKNSRKNAGFTQEQANEFLNVSLSALQDYERGATPVPEDIAKKMSVLYKDRFLKYLHARTHETASEFLPEIKETGLSQAALQVICAGKNFEIVQTKMAMLAADGKIDTHEMGEWNLVMEAAANVARAAFVLMFAKND